MSELSMILCMAIMLAPLWLLMSRDYIGALAYGIVILVACTHLIRIETPGSLPELTIHRLVILSLLLGWLRHRDRGMRFRDVPLARYIQVWALVAFISLLFCVDYVIGIKRFLDYVIEFFLLYFILATSLRRREDALRILYAVCFALTIVALLAFVEKYTGINVVDRFVATSTEDGGSIRDVRATYRHRILLGTGMAMGFPLACYLAQSGATRMRRRLAGLAMLAMLAACYFAMSRGPWLATMLAAGLLLMFGTSAMRRRLTWIACLTGFLLLLRPGVWDTLAGYAEDTVNVDSFKGGTFMYRLELWRIAFHEITKSPWRFLFGYGPGSGAEMNLEWTLSFSGEDYTVWSWDNDLAYALYQYGMVGLLATFALYAAIPWKLINHARNVSYQRERDLFVCLAASTLVLFFMMSNVMIFARQLYYLLWIFTATGFLLMARRPRPLPHQSVAAPPGSLPLPSEFAPQPSSSHV